MRLTVRRIFIATLLATALTASFAFGMAEDTPLLALARLATALSQNDSPAALAVFDHSSKDYGMVEESIVALTAQAEVLCAIEIVQELPEHTLDTDWYLQMKPRGGGEAVRRRTRVTVSMRLDKGKWKIVSLTPASVLGAIIVP